MYEDSDAIRVRPWSRKERGLIAWYKKARAGKRLPEKPFKLAPFMFVFVPERHYDMLDFEVGHEQAETLRGTRGVVTYDLESLYAVVEGRGYHAEIPVLFEDGAESQQQADVPEAVHRVPVLFE
jgi:hypothetical protein